MILTYQKRIQISLRYLLVLSVLSVFCIPTELFAQSAGLSLSVTPTLFQMSAVPEQAWNSGIKVINNNRHPLTIYAQVVNFAPQGETGQGKFIPVLEKSTEGSTLAEWVAIENEPVVIPPEQSYTFPFTIHVPKDASPGGHFAAIMIGTKPPEVDGTVQVKTSQVVTSLLFVRVAGDVVENGVIREFDVTHSFVDTPKANFEVRFENKGNVHLQPQGDIVITNMWGKERGVIPINQQTHFGNVLPESIRKFEFSWSGEQSFSDIGRYKAILTLAYGNENKKFETSTLYFYVVPIKAGVIVLGSLIAFILFMSWAIKAYVRKMLMLAGVDAHTPYQNYLSQKRTFVREGDVQIVKRVSVQGPVHNGVLDLQKRLSQSPRAFLSILTVLWQFIVSYKLFFGSLIVFVFALCALVLFIVQATEEHRDYEIVIDNADTDITLSSESILYQEHNATDIQVASSSMVLTEESPVQQEQPYKLIITNSSDTPGAAASLKIVLESQGYIVSDLQSDFEKSKEKTVVVYDSVLQEEALMFSKKLNNALLSATQSQTQELPVISIYIGNDYNQE